MNLKNLEIRISNQCSNHCAFCYLRTYDAKVGNTIEHIKRATQILEENEINQLTISGGDLFSYSEYSEAFDTAMTSLFTKINEMLLSNKLSKLILEASLLPQEKYQSFDIFRAVSMIEDKSKVVVSTSYDAEGRFTKDSLEGWITAIRNLRNDFDSVEVRCKMIMTQALIDKISSGELDLKRDIMSLGFSDIQFLVPTCAYSSSDLDSDFCRKEDFNEEKGLDFFPKRSAFLSILPTLQAQLGPQAIAKMFDRADYPDNIAYWIEDIECFYPFNSNRLFEHFIATCERDDGYIDSNESMRQDVIEYCKGHDIECESGI